jgi:prolipoprotein diacylglyceryltransferase
VLFHVLFGGTRFLWEFLRDNNKIIKFARMNGALTAEREVAYWGISNRAIWALISFLVGVVMFICLRRYHKRHPELN